MNQIDGGKKTQAACSPHFDCMVHVCMLCTWICIFIYIERDWKTKANNCVNKWIANKFPSQKFVRQLTLCVDSFHICMFILCERVSDGIYRIKWHCMHGIFCIHNYVIIQTHTWCDRHIENQRLKQFIHKFLNRDFSRVGEIPKWQR